MRVAVQMRMRAAAQLSFALLVVPHALAAQQSPVGRLEGIASASHGSHPVAGATVELSRIAPEPVVTFDASADSAGRFRFDSLPPGDYVVHVSTSLLDSLGLALPERSVTVQAGQVARADFAIPHGATLRDAVCPGLALGKGKGVVAGRAIDADTDQPLDSAQVVVTWTELVVDSTLESRSQEFSAAVQTGARGEYRLCGVPADTRLSLQIQHAGRASAAVDVTVTAEAGAEARNLSLSPRGAPTLASLDSLEHSRAGTEDPADALLLTGSAGIAGVVRGSTGMPLSNTEIRIRGARSSAVSDATGRFSIAALPAGTQMLLVRHIGYEPIEVVVELRAGQTVQHDVQLTRAILLDSVRVVAMRSQYPEFEYNRRANPFGRYLGPDDVARRHATETTELMVGVAGLTVVGRGPAARVESTRHRTGAHGCSGVNVIVDGREDVSLNDIPPSQVAAVEIYSDGSFAPSRFAIRGSCGVVVVWTTASRRVSPPRPSRDAESP